MVYECWANIVRHRYVLKI